MVIDFPPKVDAAWLDGAIARSLESEDSTMTLRLRGWEDMQIFAEGRLLQWMRRLAQRGVPFDVDLGIHLPALEDDPHHPLWQFMRERLGAMLMVDGASKVRDAAGLDRRDEIKDCQKAVLRSGGTEVGFGRECALLCWDALGTPRTFRVFVDEEQAFEHLESRIDQMAKVLGIEAIGDILGDLTTFAYELVANTHMHACDDLEGEPIDGVRFVQIRRLRINRQRRMEQLPTAEGAPQAFLQRLADSGILEKEGSEKTFIEVTVADSGVGIPARLHGSTGIYRGPIEEEQDATERAILTEASSRPSSVMGRGQGLDTAVKMARLLHGLVAIRTGRLELVRDTTLPADAGEEWQLTEGPYLPGTVFSLLLPWWKGAQGEIDEAGR